MISWRSMRVRAVGVVVAVVVLPLALVWLADAGDHAAGEGLSLATRTGAAAAADAVRAGDLDGLDRIAWMYGLRLRVVGEDGSVVADHDHASGGYVDRMAASLFFGPTGAPSLADWEATAPDVAGRPEVVAARSDGESSSCQRADQDALIVCVDARRVAGPSGTDVVVAEAASRRAFRALYDARYQMIKLTLYMLVVGGLLGLWLAWRLVGPIERLREQVVAARGHRAPRVIVDRDDEIGDLSRAFDALLQTLDLRSRANAAFVADLVHELKNPVAAVRAAAEQLEGDRPIDAERARRLGRVLGDSSRRLDAVVTRFLDLARAEAGLPDQERVPVDVGALADGVVAAARLRTSVPIDVRREGDATVQGVPERLETAIRNLVDNAVSFATSRVDVAVTAPSFGVIGEVAVIVDDDGPGVAPEDVGRVFDRFFTRRPDAGGTGLGLALVRAIAAAHGGTATVEPREKGSRFVLRLPR